MESLSAETVRKAILDLDPYTQVERRFGARVARKMHGVFGKTRPTNIPLGKVYIDHTPLDVHLAIPDEHGRLVYAGRTNATFVVDDHCALPVGAALSFHRPKIGDVMAAVRNAILPKTYTQAWVGKGLRAPLETMGMFDSIWSDNGLELKAHAMFLMLEDLGSSQATAPKYEPWWRGRQERMNRTINTKLVHRLAGTTFGRPGVKELEYDGRHFACLEFADLWWLLHVVFEEIATEWNEGIQDIPLRRWRDGVNLFPVDLPTDPVQFDANLSIRYSRVIGRQGIELLGLYYSNDELEALKRRAPATKTYTVCMCPDDLNQVYVIDPADGRPIPVPCATRRAEPLSLAEHNAKRVMTRLRGRPTQDALDASAERSEFIHAKSVTAMEAKARQVAAGAAQRTAMAARAASARPVANGNAAVGLAERLLAQSRKPAEQSTKGERT